jgi:fumarate hydratase class I
MVKKDSRYGPAIVMKKPFHLGVYKTYTEENLRYSQNAPLTMYDEVNTKCNLPAQIDIEATEGMEYKFLCVTKGGGSANKTYLYQETKAVS